MTERNDQHAVDSPTASGGEPAFPFTFAFPVSVMACPDIDMTEADDQHVVDNPTASGGEPAFPFTFTFPVSVMACPDIDMTEADDQPVAELTESANGPAFPFTFTFPPNSKPFSERIQPVMDMTEPNDQPVVISTASGNETALPITSNPFSEMAQPVIDTTEPNNQPVVNSTASRNECAFPFKFTLPTSSNPVSVMTRPVLDMTEANGKSVVNFRASEKEPDVDMATFENQAVVNIISTRHRTGILDLPSELRVMIFHHLLVQPDGIDLAYESSEPRPSLHILRTSRLIHREASEVLYRENRFLNFLGTMYLCLDTRRFVNTIPVIADQIQNIHVKVDLNFKSFAINDFRTFIPCLGDSSTIRGSLTVEFDLGFIVSRWFFPMRWFIRALGRFTNFKAIELHVCSSCRRDHGAIFDVLEHLKLNLEPVLGNVEDLSSEANGLLRFHPLNHRNRLDRLVEPDDDDWVDSLDGLRLEWNEAEAATNADDTETPGET